MRGRAAAAASSDEESISMEMSTAAPSSLLGTPRSTISSSSRSDYDEALNDNLREEEGPDVEEAAHAAPSNEGAQAQEAMGPRNRARRLQGAVRDIIREHYLCLVLIWILFVLALAIGTFVTFIEMLIVFRRHHDDACDVPLYLFVWLNVATFIYHNTLHLCVQRWLGYDPTLYNTDEPIPAAVARYEVFVQFWSLLICILGVVLVSEAKTCQETAPQLYRAVWRFTWTAFALGLACLVTSVSTAIFVYLMRHGHLSTSDAAPQAIQRCRVVKYKPPRSEEDEALLAVDGAGAGAGGGHGEAGEGASAAVAVATCPICIEPFDSEKEIRVTPCRHLFHGQCLSGWLNVSRCCPMCRHDFLGETPPPPPRQLPTSSGNRRAAGGNRRGSSTEARDQDGPSESL